MSINISQESLILHSLNKKFLSNYNNSLNIAFDHSALSAYGNLNVNNLDNILNLNFQYSINPRLITTTLVGAGTATQTNAMANLVLYNADDSVIIKSNESIKFRGGMGVIARFSCVFNAEQSNVTQMIGIGESENGLFFGYNSDAIFGIFRRTKISGSVVEVFTPQTSFDIDKCNGLYELPLMNWQKFNSFQIIFNLCSMHFYVQDHHPGTYVEVHSIDYANANILPPFNNTIFKLRAEYSCTGAPYNYDPFSICEMSAFVEGDSKLLGIVNSLSNTKSGITTEVNVLTLRNRAVFNSKTNFNYVYPFIINIATIGGTKPVLIKIIQNETLTTPTYTNLNLTQSIIEYDVVGVLTGNGYIVSQFWMSKEDSKEVDISKYFKFLKPSDTLTLSAYSTNAADVSLSITFLEDL